MGARFWWSEMDGMDEWMDGWMDGQMDGGDGFMDWDGWMV